MRLCLLHRTTHPPNTACQRLTEQIGSVIIVLHAPSDKEVETVDEILDYAARFPFLCYLGFVAVFATYMIYRVVPTHGTKTPLVYLSICSLVGSVSVMAIKVSLNLVFLVLTGLGADGNRDSGSR